MIQSMGSAPKIFNFASAPPCDRETSTTGRRNIPHPFPILLLFAKKSLSIVAHSWASTPPTT